MDVLIIIIINILIILLSLLIIYLCLKNREMRREKKGEREQGPWALKNLQKYFNRINRDSKKDTKIKIPTLYINLDRSTERREMMENQLALVSNNYEPVSAIDGKKLDNLESGSLNGISFINEYQNITPSELGCTLSHLKAIRKVYNKKYEYALIVEDDCCFDMIPFWTKSLMQVIKDAPKDWEIIQIFSLKCTLKHDQPYMKYKQGDYCYSTLAYIINRKGATKIMNIAGKNKFVLGKLYNKNSISLNEYSSNASWVDEDKIVYPPKGQADRYEKYKISPFHEFLLTI